MLVRKYAIIAVATFVEGNIRQLHFVLAVLILALHLHDSQKPFGHRNTGRNSGMLHRLETGSLLLLLFLLWCGVYFYVSLKSGDGLCISDAGACQLLVVMVVGSNVGYLILVSARCCSEWGKRNHLQKRLIAVASGLRRLGSSRSVKEPRQQEHQPKPSRRMSAEPGIELHVNPMERKGGHSTWASHLSEGGHEFFVNEETGESVWADDLPEGAVVSTN